MCHGYKARGVNATEACEMLGLVWLMEWDCRVTSYYWLWYGGGWLECLMTLYVSLRMV